MQIRGYIKNLNKSCFTHGYCKTSYKFDRQLALYKSDVKFRRKKKPEKLQKFSYRFELKCSLRTNRNDEFGKPGKLCEKK